MKNDIRWQQRFSNFQKTLKQLNLFSLSGALDDLNLPYTFDLCIYEDLSNPDFIDHIDRVGLVFYSQQE